MNGISKRDLSVLILLIIGIGLIILGLQPELRNTIFSFNTKLLPEEPTSEAETIKLVASIAQRYSNTHTYISDDVFDCDNMAQDVWNMLKARGIKSEIVVGNVDNSSAITFQDINHAWLMVELESGKVAVETTGGYLVYQKDNSNYYRGFVFDDPKKFREFLVLYNDRNSQIDEFNTQLKYYTQLVEAYNNSNITEQKAMLPGIQDTHTKLKEIRQRIDETWTKIATNLNRSK